MGKISAMTRGSRIRHAEERQSIFTRRPFAKVSVPTPAHPWALKVAKVYRWKDGCQKTRRLALGIFQAAVSSAAARCVDGSGSRETSYLPFDSRAVGS